ncbi:MAG: hypothetical protein ACYS1A_15770 [Planctomycetota bacterium]
MRARGIGGLCAIGDTISKAVREQRVRVGPLKTAYYVLHDGYWLIADDLSDIEKSGALIWLACAELKIPKDLSENLVEDFSQYRNGLQSSVWDQANDIFMAYLNIRK